MKKTIKTIIIYAIVFLTIFGIYSFMNYDAEPATIDISKLVREINSENVKKITITDNEAEVEFYDEIKVKDVAVKNVKCEIQSTIILYELAGDNLKKQIKDNKININIKKPSEAPWWLSALPSIIFIL